MKKGWKHAVNSKNLKISSNTLVPKFIFFNKSTADCYIPTACAVALVIRKTTPPQLTHVSLSFLKLYTTMPVAKLAGFLDMTEQEFRIQLLVFKHKMKNLVWTSGISALDGEFQSASEVDFYIDKVSVWSFFFLFKLELLKLTL